MPRGSKYRTSAANLPCTQRGCHRTFRSESGRTNHVWTTHPNFDGHQLPVNPQEVIPESPTSSVSDGSPMMLSSPFQSPSSAPERQEHKPKEYIPRLKWTYHPFINGLHLFHLSHETVSLYLSVRSTMRCRWELPPWRNPTTSLNSKKKKKKEVRWLDSIQEWKSI